MGEMCEMSKCRNLEGRLKSNKYGIIISRSFINFMAEHFNYEE